MTKFFKLLRTAWKQQQDNVDLKKKLLAKQAESKRQAEQFKFRADESAQKVTRQFESVVHNILQHEQEKEQVRQQMIAEKLAQVQIDPEKIKKRVTSKLLDKWETALAPDAGAAGGLGALAAKGVGGSAALKNAIAGRGGSTDDDGAPKK